MHATRRITLIGPMPPAEGGVSEHAMLLKQAFQNEGHSVLPIAFKHLYPTCLHPSARPSHFKDLQTYQPDVHYILDYKNPLSWVRAFKQIQAFKPDIVIIAWWTFFFAPQIGCLARALRKNNIRTTFICHNVYDHECHPAKKMLTRWALSAADGYIVHAQSEIPKLEKFAPAHAIKKTLPMPLFNRLSPTFVERKPNTSFTLLYFGIVRPYKGIPILIDALEQIRHHNISTHIVGEWWMKDASTLKRILNGPASNSIRLVDRFVKDAQIVDYFNNADAVVLPYLSATGSAVASLALQFERPIIGSDVGGLTEAVIDGQTGILVPANNAHALAEAILEMKSRIAGGHNYTLTLRAHKHKHCWQHYTQQILCTADRHA